MPLSRRTHQAALAKRELVYEAMGSLPDIMAVATAHLAVGETVILLHPPLVVVGVSIGMEREHQQNDSLTDG